MLGTEATPGKHRLLFLLFGELFIFKLSAGGIRHGVWGFVGDQLIFMGSDCVAGGTCKQEGDPDLFLFLRGELVTLHPTTAPALEDQHHCFSRS